MEFKKPHNWESLLTVTTSGEDYRNIVNAMFTDGFINKGRIHVLERYTTDVCLRLDSTTSHDIRQHFETFKWNIMTPLEKLCSLLQKLLKTTHG